MIGGHPIFDFCDLQNMVTVVDSGNFLPLYETSQVDGRCFGTSFSAALCPTKRILTPCSLSLFQPRAVLAEISRVW
eukprot:507154-Rhodomonas_salina.1